MSAHNTGKLRVYVVAKARWNRCLRNSRKPSEITVCSHKLIASTATLPSDPTIRPLLAVLYDIPLRLNPLRTVEPYSVVGFGRVAQQVGEAQRFDEVG